MFRVISLIRFYGLKTSYVNGGPKNPGKVAKTWATSRFFSTPALQGEKSDQDGKPDIKIKPFWLKNNIDKEIFSATSKYDIFEAVKNERFSPNNAVFAINTLSRWMKEGKLQNDEVASTTELKIIEETIRKGNVSLSISQITQAIRNLVALGISPKSETIDSLTNDIIWRIRKSKLWENFLALEFQSKFLHSELQHKALADIKHNIQLRWVELKDAQDFIAALQSKEHFDQKFLEKIESHMLEFVETFSQEDRAKVLIALSNNKRRPTPLLQALCYHMNNEIEPLSIRHSVDVLYALNQLSFPNQSLVERICNDLENQPSEKLTGGIISSLSSSLGQLKYRHEGLFLKVCEWVDKNFETCRNQDIMSLVSCLGAVHYTPANWETLSGRILKRLHLQVENHPEGRESIWLNVVWSSACLNIATPELILSVLNRQFFTRILNPRKGQAANPFVLSKLNQLWFLTRLSNIDVLGLPHDMPLPIPPADGKEKSTPLRDSVLEAIASLVPSPKYLKSNTKTSLGIDVDGEFLLNSTGVPAPLNTKVLPNQKRLALMILDYKDTCLGSSHPTGIQAFREHLLSLSGYRVIKVSHKDFDRKGKLLKRVQVLEGYMKAALSQTDQTS